jgi:proline dehydrogenase
LLAIVDRLAGRARHVAVTTHDAPLALASLDRLRAAGTACELEVLLGVGARVLVRAARARGVAVRVYVPFGRPFLRYAFQGAPSDAFLHYRVLRDRLSSRWPPVGPGGRPASAGSLPRGPTAAAE